MLDFAVVVTHDLLEHDVDEGASFMAEAGGVGEVFATALARIDAQHPDALAGAGVGAAFSRSMRGPLPLAPGRVRAVSSLGLREAGRLELMLLLGVCFSMNTAINTLNSISRASNRARLSALILPSAHSDANRPSSASNSARSDCLFTVAMGAWT